MLSHLQAAINKLEDVPRPGEYVYHVTPYADEIMEQGFEINPDRQVFGGAHPAISVTTLEDAQKYAEDLKLMIGFVYGELDWNQTEQILANKGLDVPFNAYVVNTLTSDFFYKEYTHAEETGSKDYSWVKIFPEGITDPKELDKAAFDTWLIQVAHNELNWDGSKTTPEQERQRRWTPLHFLWNNSVAEFALFSGGNPPANLVGKTMQDVKIIEVAIAPVAPATESSSWQPSYFDENDKDPKGKYTFNPSENEWRFYDTTDLWPARIVGIKHLQAALDKLI